ncbi:MAG: T9SS type A sorting domain-containing protein [Lentimicrobiaceae bacterium]|nr:T9SS type A sorting domain-containing protein [Lentimicrobiaceae bacterium]
MKKKLFIITVSLFFSLFLISSFFPCSAQCLAPTNKTYININDINATIKTNGTLFFDEGAGFEVPKGSGKKTLFSASLWLGGLDEQDNLHLAAMRYAQIGNDFWAGPISNGGAAAGSYYDKIWRVTKEEIEYHKAHHGDPYYITPLSLLDWPAHGREMYQESYYLAPFVNVAGSERYEPELGDYPLIRGDEALFFMLNDDCGSHTETQGVPLGVEILCMVYAFNDPDDDLQHTLFISYEIRNKSDNNYKDFHIGFFSDFEIGYGYDDYIGCDTLLNLGYGYNATIIDGDGEIYAYGENPPAQGAMFLNKKMSTFAYFNNGSGATSDPTISYQYYNYMKALWKDQTPFTYGGTGYDLPSDHTKYMFSGDPVTKTGWTELTPYGPESSPNSPNDRRGLLAAGPYMLSAGESVCIDIAFPWAQAEKNNIASVALLKQRANTIQQFYNAQNYEDFCFTMVGIKDNINNHNELIFFPNPSNGHFTVNSKTIIESIELYDVVGKKVFSDTPQVSTPQISTDLPQGLYFYRVVTKDNAIHSGKILVQ